jgi:hypothetical protein
VCELNEVINVICEGYSEQRYLTLINRFFRTNKVNITFHPIEIGGGHFNVVKGQLKRHGYLKKKTNYSEVFVWVDKDVYIRDEQGNNAKYEAFIKEYPGLKFCFNYLSFEDFFMLHQDVDTIKKWHDMCRKEGHFKNPIKSEKCLKMIKKLVPDYEKGSLPSEFRIDENSLKHLFRNSEAYKNWGFGSDIIAILQNIWNKIEK